LYTFLTMAKKYENWHRGEASIITLTSCQSALHFGTFLLL